MVLFMPSFSQSFHVWFQNCKDRKSLKIKIWNLFDSCFHFNCNAVSLTWLRCVQATTESDSAREYSRSPRSRILRENTAGRSPRSRILRENMAGISPWSQTLRDNMAGRSPRSRILRDNMAGISPRSQTLRENTAGRSPRSRILRKNTAGRSPPSQTLRENTTGRSPRSRMHRWTEHQRINEHNDGSEYWNSKFEQKTS